MAFSDGFNRIVTVYRRGEGSESQWHPVSVDVPCRVTSMSTQEVQAISETYAYVASHRALAPLHMEVGEGDRLCATMFRAPGGAWKHIEQCEWYEVTFCEYAEGGAAGPHHLRLWLSRATPVRM